MTLLKEVIAIRNILIVILTPIVLLPLPLAVEGQEAPCGYVMIIMAVYWITEALPIYVTGLLPVFLFPVVGVMSASAVCSVFLNAATLMFTGGMVVAVAIEEWNLHKKIALKMLLLLGSKPVWLMLGLMITAWFLSMWISNTATTAMMLPIVNAILDHLNDDKMQNGQQEHTEESHIELTAVVNDDETQGDDADKTRNGNTPHAVAVSNRRGSNDVDWQRVRKAFNLCVAYAADIGGTASMTGSTPNLVLKGQADLVYEKLGKRSPLTFGTWLLYGIPTSFIIVMLAWVWLMVYFLRCRSFLSCCHGQNDADATRVKRILQLQYSRLGKFSFAQKAVIGHLVLLVILWTTRDLGGVYGWSRLFQDKFINDAVPAILVGIFVFTFPSSIPRIFCCRVREPSAKVEIRPLLSWEQFNKKMPWGVVTLLGGGFSIAKAAQVSGLSDVIGNQLLGLNTLEPWLLTLVLCLIIAACTEVTSNTATTALILPILSNLAITLGLEPIYLMMPATFAASFAFMLPVATPPNAVVFSSGHVKVIDMVKAGVMLNFIAVLVLLVANETLGKLIF